MRTATLTITFSAEKLDVLTFHMAKKEASLQEELNDTVPVSYTHLTLPTTERV